MKRINRCILIPLIALILGGCNSSPKEDTYVVRYTSSDDYSITGLLEKYKENDTVNFTVNVLNDSKEIEEVKADNSILTSSDSVYTFTMPNHDVNLDVSLKNKKTSVKYNISFEMTTSRSYAFKNEESDLILNTFVLDDEEDNSVINEVSDFTYIYGGGYGGSGDTKWAQGDMLKFGTTSIDGGIILSLNKPVNKAVLTGLVGNTSCKLQIGDSGSTDWATPSSDNKTTTLTCSNMNVANKETVESKDFTNIEFEFESTTSLKISTINNKVFYLTNIEFFFSNVKTYTVTWLDENGTVLKVDENVTEGTVPEYKGEEPSKDGYDFVGWDPTPSEIYQDTTYTAVFKEKGQTYTVTWLNYDEEVLKVDENVAAGTTPTYSGPNPSKPSDDHYNYYFSGWDPIPAPISSDMTYTAQYTKVDKTQDLPGYNPVISSDGKYIEYGLYPQTHVKDQDLIELLEYATTISTGWRLYNNEFYFKATSKIYNNESYKFNDGEDIVDEKEYWFKCEPIKWNIVSKENNRYVLMSNVLLDAYCYYRDYSNRSISGSAIYPNNYKESDIRKWLNGTFLENAFMFGTNLLETLTVNNSGFTTDTSSNEYACENTSDKVYLPSYQEINGIDDKKAQTTDYARAMGAWSNTKDNQYKYNGSYWTRSPSSLYSYCAWNVNSGGVLSEYAVDGNSHSVRPCIVINLI